jgi:hypothetical protein
MLGVSGGSEPSPLATALAVVFGVLFVLLGWVIVRDWRRLGTRIYKFNRYFPGGGWYEKRGRGYQSFQLWIGGGYLAFGAILLVVALAVFVAAI